MLPLLRGLPVSEAAALRLPLRRAGYFDGRGLGGRALPYFLPTQSGVVVTCPSTLALYDHTLTERRWALSVVETADSFWEETGRLFYGSTTLQAGGEPYFIEVGLESGRCSRQMYCPGTQRFAGVTASTVLLRFKEGGSYWLRALERQRWGEIWRRASHAEIRIAPSRGERYFVTSPFGTELLCLDALTGECLWRFQPLGRSPAKKLLEQSSRIGTGFPSVVVVGDRVIITTLDCRVFAVSAETGELLGHGEPPVRGAYLVTARSVFFKQPFGLSEFDHRVMQEVARLEYRDEVEPLYRGRQPSANAFWLTEESVVWTTMHGALMGASRQVGPGGRRVVWLDETAGAIMPIGQAPVGYGDYLYYAAGSQVSDGPMGLYCYTSA